MAHKDLQSQIHNFLTWLLCCTGFAALARRILTHDRRFVLMFHGISSHKYPDLSAAIQPSLSKDDLRAVLSWLQPRFAFLTPNEFLVTEKPGLLLTFDDGLANNLTNALPILEDFNAPAVLFVTTQHVLKPRDWLPASRVMIRKGWMNEEAIPEDLAADFYNGMSEEQLANCASHPLITIGSHTISHPFLTRCDSHEVERELRESKRTLEGITGQSVDLFAYPTGDYDLRVAEAVHLAGYRVAFAVDSLNIGLPRFEIPRVGIYNPNPPYLSLKLSGLHRRSLPPKPWIAND